MPGVLQMHVKKEKPTDDPLCVAATALVNIGELFLGKRVKHLISYISSLVRSYSNMWQASASFTTAGKTTVSYHSRLTPNFHSENHVHFSLH